MLEADLLRNTVALYLATMDLFTAPLRNFTRAPAVSEGDRRALQEEVWDRWGEQHPPVSAVLFP